MADPKVDTRIKSARFSYSQEKALLAMNKVVLTAEAGSTAGAALPTVSTGLTTGMLWNNAGVVTVVA